jgi:1-phosphofructokinase family hexose kinase
LIYAITFNPALDIGGSVDQLIPDEKIYVTNENHHPGGNGINAAIIIHRLGIDVIATGFLGGQNGTEIELLLDKENVKNRFVKISGNTRMNITVSNRKTFKQTRLSFPGPKIKPNELKNLNLYLNKLIPNDIVLIGGSLPPGITPVYINKIIKNLKKKNILCLVDMPGKILSEVISSHPYFIKPNLIEFQELVGKNVSSMKAILPLVRKLNELVPLICVSSVEGGAILVTKNEAWFGKIPKVKILSTVGAGDSMVGAIAAQLAINPSSDIKVLLRLGLAAACATLSTDGMLLGSKQMIIKYSSKIQIKKID